jgi:hypothetical protein
METKYYEEKRNANKTNPAISTGEIVVSGESLTDGRIGKFLSIS